MIKLTSEQAEEEQLKNSVMKAPRSTAMALRDFFFGRTISDQFNNTFAGGGAGAFTVPPGTPAKGVKWFPIQMNKYFPGEKAAMAAGGKLEDMKKVFNSAGDGTFWTDLKTGHTRYTDHMHQHQVLHDEGNKVFPENQVSYSGTARGRYHDSGTDVWPPDFTTAFDSRGIQNPRQLERNSRLRDDARQELINILGDNDLLRGHVSGAKGMQPRPFKE